MMRIHRCASIGCLGLVIAFLLAGCSDQRVIEKLGFIRTIAFESAGEGEEGKIRVTVSIPKTKPNEAVHYTAIARTAREARIIFDRQNDRRIVNGQLRQALFGASLAEQGLWPHIDSLLRDATVGNRVHILVLEGPAEPLLERTYLQSGTAGEYIDNLIRVETGAMNLPDTTIHSFVRDYYDDGIEPVAAMIRGTPNSIIFNGIAVFRKDKLVGKIVPDDFPFFGALYGDVKSGDLFMDFVGDRYQTDASSMLYFSSKRKVKVLALPSHEGAAGPKVAVKLSVSGSILEYTGPDKVSDPESQIRLESEIAAYFKEKSETLIRQLQQERSDAIGIGQYVRNAMPYAEWKKLDWEETFATADIDVQVRVRIKNFGKMQ